MKKSILLIITVLLIIGSSTVAFALPENTILIGEKAFSIFLLADPDYYSEIDEAIKNTNPTSVYYKMDDSVGFVSLISEEDKMTDEAKGKLNSIHYVDSEGKRWNYDSFNDSNPDQTDEDFKIIDIH